MFVRLNIPCFDELLRKFVYSFKSRIQVSCNSLVNGVVKSSVPLFSKIWAWWNDILNTTVIKIIVVCENELPF